MTENNEKYPLLISEDNAGFKSDLRIYLDHINRHVPELQKHYANMKLSADFDTDIWPKLALENVEFLQIMAHEKVEGIKQMLGIPDGVTITEIVTHLNDSIRQIKSVLSRLQSGGQSATGSKHTYMPHNVELKGSVATIKQEVLNSALESYRVYINTPQEHAMRNSVAAFSEAYNQFKSDLKGFGFKHFSSLGDTYLHNLFTQSDDGSLIPKDTAHQSIIRSRNM